MILVQLVPLVLPVRQEHKVLQEILVRLGLQARKVSLGQQDPQVLQAQRVQRERQVQQDLKVIKETSERLDLLVP